jgi:metallophosphoesterase superfamily enzyme
MTTLPEHIPSEDILNILVASDVHLGYAEKDACRGMACSEVVVGYALCLGYTE